MLVPISDVIVDGVVVGFVDFGSCDSLVFEIDVDASVDIVCDVGVEVDVDTDVLSDVDIYVDVIAGVDGDVDVFVVDVDVGVGFLVDGVVCYARFC